MTGITRHATRRESNALVEKESLTCCSRPQGCSCTSRWPLCTWGFRHLWRKSPNQWRLCLDAVKTTKLPNKSTSQTEEAMKQPIVSEGDPLIFFLGPLLIPPQRPCLSDFLFSRGSRVVKLAPQHRTCGRQTWPFIVSQRTSTQMSTRHTTTVCFPSFPPLHPIICDIQSDEGASTCPSMSSPHWNEKSASWQHVSTTASF